MSEILELKNISKSYGKTKVLENINLKIKNNEFFTILGSSGSGKSTIIRMIGGFVKPSSGQIIFENSIINDQPIFERPFNTVFQDYALFPNMNVFNNVGFGLKIKNINQLEIRNKVQEVLSVVGLENFADRMPQELSGGQQQRVAVARALASKPKFILADEPTANLDTSSTSNLLDIMSKLNVNEKITFIFSTHDQRVINRARRVITLEDGKIVSDKKK